MQIKLSTQEAFLFEDIMESIEKGSTEELKEAIEKSNVISIKVPVSIKNEIVINVDEDYMNDFLKINAKYAGIIVQQLKLLMNLFEMFNDDINDVVYEYANKNSNKSEEPEKEEVENNE